MAPSESVSSEALRRQGSEVDENRQARRVFANPSNTDAVRRGLVLVGSALALVVVAVIDYWLGFEISFSLFYLFPIVGATWYGGRWLGLAYAVIGAALWAFSDQMSGHTYSHRAVPYWNAGVRLAYFTLVAELIWRLQRLLARERHQSETDALTGVFNRSGWFEAAQIELARARREGHPIAVAYLDLDDFKRINDTRGHEEGDRVLERVAATLRRSVRRSDVIARLGGDEFAVFLVNIEPVQAKSLCDELHATLASEMKAHRWPVGFSIGIAAFVEAPATVQEILKRADDVMYAAKREGKNTVRLDG